MTDHPDYLSFIDRGTLVSEFPVGDGFQERLTAWTPEQLRTHQEKLFLRLVERAAAIPFYQRLWGAAGVDARDIKGLDDLSALPVYDKSDIMASIAHAPPWGDFHGIDDFSSPDRPPVIVHTTSGTTGTPQVLTFGPRTREVQNLLLARAYRFQGLRPEDVVHSVYGHGLVNGGHYIREAVTHWTGARFLSAGTGIETPSRKQVELMRDFGVTVLVGFGDYLNRLAEVAHEMGIDPARDLKVRMISGHIGAQDSQALADAWGGAKVFDWYGVGDTGIVAGEGPDQDGLYVFEDAQLLELLDVDTGKPVATGSSGDMVVTSLFTSDLYPIIRFNTHDVSAFRQDASSLGIRTRRIQGFLGRSDNMVKLRGINVFPHAIAGMLDGFDAVNGEYICRVSRDASGREQMTVAVETADATQDLRKALETRLHERLGVRVAVSLHSQGELTELTGIESRQKPIRLLDER